MFIGVNTNIKYKGEIFHIQTEDGGLDQHTLTTILFKNGAILSSKKTSYIDISKSPTYDDTIKKIMQEQHKQMARDLIKGKFAKVMDLIKSEEAAPQAKEAPEENKISCAEDVKEAVSAGSQHKPVPGNALDIRIFDYLAKKDAMRV